MRKSEFLALFFVLLLLCAESAFSAITSQVGFGYGNQFRGNTDLRQYELFWRQPLPYKKTLGADWQLLTGWEAGFAWLFASASDDSATARISIMPEVLLGFRDNVNFILGFGAGCMLGETEFPGHNLGGLVLFASKVGIQVQFGRHWGIDGVYYHQSNAGIYDHNASLNMLQLSLCYRFPSR